MADPTQKTASNSQYYSPPVEAQRALMAKSHPDKGPGDVCLGVAKIDGNELLVYSKDDSGGTCHVGEVRAEKVGYISKGEVQAFIQKYSRPVQPPAKVASKAIPSLVQPRRVAAEISRNLNAHLNAEMITLWRPLAAFEESKEVYFNKILKFDSTRKSLDICAGIKAGKFDFLSESEKKILQEYCKEGSKTPSTTIFEGANPDLSPLRKLYQNE